MISQRIFALTARRLARDNAFNRERAAVKAHAAATSGKCGLEWIEGSVEWNKKDDSPKAVPRECKAG